MAAGGLLLVVFGFLLMWIVFTAVDWSKNPTPNKILNDVYAAIPD